MSSIFITGANRGLVLALSGAIVFRYLLWPGGRRLNRSDDREMQAPPHCF